MLKKISTLILAFCLSTTFCVAQNYERAIGVRLGFPAGLTYKQFTNQNTAYEIMAGVYLPRGINRTNGGFDVTVILMKETQVMVDELHVFYGGGGHVGSIESDVNVGLDVIIGLEFALAQSPIAFSFDAKPGLDLASLAKGRENFLLSGGGFTLRYTFQ
ncbi:MAG: hypothetical protein ACPG5B_16940 [Chitinophagales bacterium]